MWNYKEELEEIFRDYHNPDQNSYEPHIKISDTCLSVSMGPEYNSLTFENGVYILQHRSVEMRSDYLGEMEYRSEEEAVFHWLCSFSYVLPRDSEIRNRVNELEKRLYAVYQKEKPEA